MAILEVQGLRKSFGDLEVLKGIDLSLEQGRVLSIIGSSGSGKTTLLRCINLLERPTAPLSSTPLTPPGAGRRTCGRNGSIWALCSSRSTCFPSTPPCKM